MKFCTRLFFILLVIFIYHSGFGQTTSLTYQYDNLNRLTQIDYSNGQVVEFTYDEVGNRITHVISPFVITQNATIPPGNPSPIDVTNTQVTLDFDSGPGGEVTVQEIFSPPPVATPAAARPSEAVPLKKAPVHGRSAHTITAVSDTLIAASRYWEFSSAMQAGTFTYYFKIGYDPADFPAGLTEENVNILYFDPDSSDYIELPTVRNSAQDSVATVSPVANFGRFALGIKDLVQVNVTYNFSVATGAWYLISLPVVPQDSSLQTLFPDAAAAFGWDYTSQNYVQVTNLQPEKAYWLLLLQSAISTVTGIPVDSYTQSYTQQGWDMIGSVLASSPVVDNPPGSVAAMFGWDGPSQSYVLINPMVAEPTGGYWILVFGVPSTVTVGSSTNSSSVVASSGSVARAGSRSTDLAAFYKLYGTLPPPPPSSVFGDQYSESSLPTEFGLSQNYPNPFNPETVISYQLPVSSNVSLVIYSVLGREIRTLVDDERPAGFHRVIWDGRDEAGQRVESGVYFVRMRAGDPATGSQNKSGQAGQVFVQTRKVVLVR